MRITFYLKTDTLKAKFIPSDKPDLVYLIDTGADILVWCKGTVELLDVFEDAIPLESKCILSGFGKEPEIVDIYKISNFVLTDGDNVIRYQNFILAVTDRPQINVDLILPSSIFDHMSVTIDRKTSIVYPKIIIEYDKELYPVFYRHIRITEQQKKVLGIDTDLIIKDVYAEDEEL